MRDHLRPQDMELLIRFGAPDCDKTTFCYYTVEEDSYGTYGKVPPITLECFGMYDKETNTPTDYDPYDNDYGYSRMTSITPVFSLSELLARLPETIYDGDAEYKLRSDLRHIWYENSDGGCIYECHNNELIESAFTLYLNILTNPRKITIKK